MLFLSAAVLGIILVAGGPASGTSETASAQSAQSPSNPAPHPERMEAIAEAPAPAVLAINPNEETAAMRPDPGAAPPLPPPDTPWAELYAALAQRAARGDAPAASRLYVELERCRRYDGVRDTARRRAKIARAAEALSATEAERDLEGMSKVAAVLADGAATCAETSREELAEVRREVLLDAAEAGNASAQACFLFIPVLSAIFEPDEDFVTDYRRRAERYMRQGLARGDWAMVDLLRLYHDRPSIMHSYAPRWQAVVWRDEPLEAYLYTAVQLIGAHEAGGRSEEGRLRGVMTAISTRIPWTLEEQYTTLNQATAIYREHLASSPFVKSGDLRWCAP